MKGLVEMINTQIKYRGHQFNFNQWKFWFFMNDKEAFFYPSCETLTNNQTNALLNFRTVMFQLTAPNAICGRVIGRGGSKINSITVCN